jgi:hypothetical protein
MSPALVVSFENPHPRKKPHGAGGSGGADRGESGQFTAADGGFSLQGVQYSGQRFWRKGTFGGTHTNLRDEKVLTSGEKHAIIGG